MKKYQEMEELNESQEKKLNIEIIVLVILIVIVLAILGILCIKVLKKDNEYIPNSEYLNSVADSNNNNLDIIEETPEIIEERKKQEQRKLMLEQIKDKFNSSNFAKEIDNSGNTTIEAFVAGNNINIEGKCLGLWFSVYFELNDNILSTKIIENGYEDENILVTKGIIATMVLDCVAQVKGYNEKELYRALTKEKSMYYTLENEGVQITELEKPKGVLLSIDIDNDLSF